MMGKRRTPEMSASEIRERNLYDKRTRRLAPDRSLDIGSVENRIHLPMGEENGLHAGEEQSDEVGGDEVGGDELSDDQCEVCDKRFSTRNQKKHHTSVFVQKQGLSFIPVDSFKTTPSLTIICAKTMCCANFKNVDSYDQHNKLVHNTDPEDLVPVFQYRSSVKLTTKNICPGCFVAYSNKKNLETHTPYCRGATQLLVNDRTRVRVRARPNSSGSGSGSVVRLKTRPNPNYSSVW